MKISELTTKNFLSNAGVANDSYVLVNYKDNSTNRQVTCKASLDTLGKAIAENLNLVAIDISNGDTMLKTYKTQSGAYIQEEPDVPILNYLPIVVYDPDAEEIGYFPSGESTIVPITITSSDSDGDGEGGGSIDLSVPVLLPSEIGDDPSILSYFCMVDNNGKFYNCSDCGAAVEVMNTGKNPVIVYESNTGALGYYAEDSFTQLIKPIDITDGNDNSYAYTFMNSTGNLYTVEESEGSIISFDQGKVLFYTIDTTNNKVLLKNANGTTIARVDYEV